MSKSLDPLFWLGLSIFLVSITLTAVLAIALPTFIELRRAAQSADKLFATLEREFPPTLEAIRLSGLEISELTQDLDEGVKSAGRVAKQVDRSVDTVKQQADKAQVNTRSLIAGVKAAWHTWKEPTSDQATNIPLSGHPLEVSPKLPAVDTDDG